MCVEAISPQTAADECLADLARQQVASIGPRYNSFEVPLVEILLRYYVGGLRLVGGRVADYAHEAHLVFDPARLCWISSWLHYR